MPISNADSHPGRRAALTALALVPLAGALAQPPGSDGSGQLSALPDEPTAVELPEVAAEVTGPGPMFESAPSQAPGLGPDDFDYEADEYFVSGTADGRPYTTRVVVRRPAAAREFSGIVLAESMHYSGAAHAFEFTAAYVMDRGHAAVEILTTSPQQFVDFNAERYGELEVGDGQANDILAQVGALLKSDDSPIRGRDVRTMVMSGSSMSSATLVNYLPAHAVYRTPGMEHIYDGYMPTSTGATIQAVDVPMIQLPTMHEVAGNSITRRQDSDAPDSRFRLYEFAGIGHVDSRDNVRLKPNPCTQPLSEFPLQAYMAVGLHHLIRWADEGITPPRADRILVDRDTDDGSLMALDEHGNPEGGIRNPYVDVPTAKYVPVNTAAEPLVDDASDWVVANGGLQGAQIMCRLSAYQQPFSKSKLRELYGTEGNFRRLFEQRLDALEQAGWSLPLYRELILADAAEVEF